MNLNVGSHSKVLTRILHIHLHGEVPRYYYYLRRVLIVNALPISGLMGSGSSAGIDGRTLYRPPVINRGESVKGKK